MKKLLLLLSACPIFLSAQDLFVNRGADVYIQPGALIHVQGNVRNDDDLLNVNPGRIFNNGVLEISQSGGINNVSLNANEFTTYSGYSGGERVVKFVGNGTQNINGTFDGTNARFYNLVIDKATSGSLVQVNTIAQVEGVLVFGSSTIPQTAASYGIPTSVSQLTDNGGLGLVRISLGGSNRLVLLNADTGAISGYAALNMASDPSDGYIQTSGLSGGSDDGLHRTVSTGNLSRNYVFPLGSPTRRYQPFVLNFSQLPSASRVVMGKFLEQTTSGVYPVNITQSCVNCGIYPTPLNDGFNYFVPSAQLPSCYSNPDGQWVILENAFQNHGIWFTGDATDLNETDYRFTIETFPTKANLTEEGGTLETSRSVFVNADYVADLAGLEATNLTSTDFTSNIVSVSDLVEYSLIAPASSCYTGTGIPGGVYNDLGGTFFLAKSKSNNALPVELLYLNAYPVNNQFIQVSWATALEINNDGFFVERSTDGINFSTIGWVEGNDNTTTTHYYTFDDVNVAPNVVYYYRLKQMDNDGAFEYTYIVNAMITSGEVFNISEFIPNPAQDLTKLIVTTSSNVDINVKLFGVLGQLLSEKDYSLTAGSSNLDFDIRNYAEGTYTALITANNKVYTKKLVVTHK